jgi:uncharacterized membrane protein YdjX (TVP38/TMEM64 family)
MDETVQPQAKNKRAATKAVILLAFIITALVVFHFTPAKTFFSAAKLESFLESTGTWAPPVFMVVYALGVCLFIPGTILGALGAVCFGAYLGFVYVWVGAMAGASAAFFIGTLKEVWVKGNWGELLSLKVLFSLCLFAFSLFIPKMIKRIKEGPSRWQQVSMGKIQKNQVRFAAKK